LRRNNTALNGIRVPALKYAEWLMKKSSQLMAKSEELDAKVRAAASINLNAGREN